jgi:Na+/H+-translocating membrane pyrophosphatase
MVFPGIIVVAMPIATGLVFKAVGNALGQAGLGAEAVAGFLMVGTIAGILMAMFLNNAGGAWDNAKKFIEMGNHGGKRSEAHKAAVVGDTVGDPFKDTSSVAMNPIIKFATLFGLLAVELAVNLKENGHEGLLLALAIAFGLAMLFFVWRSFYGMRISGIESESAGSTAASPAE